MVFMVCFYVFLLDILINIDHGAVPAALSDISQDLNIVDTGMGLLGSLVFFGLVVGSVTASVVLGRFQYKNILITSLLANAISLWLFTAKSSYYYMCLARFITGYSQIFLTIYIPLYIDAYSTLR